MSYKVVYEKFRQYDLQFHPVSIANADTLHEALEIREEFYKRHGMPNQVESKCYIEERLPMGTYVGRIRTEEVNGEKEKI